MSVLANACKAINNANRAMKREVFIKHSSKETKDFLIEMKKHGYISALTFIPCGTKEKIVVGLNGRLTKCGAICPRFRYACDEIQDAANKLKPARQFGHVIFKTDKGPLDQKEANELRAGGSIMGFFY
ncbi:small subunit ribosomal protein S15Ae [Enteropsectra breve]|nr:small subunit ribosomal protein S15Ae [Enteropsectra breve]KAI5152095.1 small subunit ribosomal protein S15Ae [Enteropsectra breve]